MINALDPTSDWIDESLTNIFGKVAAVAQAIEHRIYVFAVEALTVFTKVLPNAIKWCWRVRFARTIVYQPLSTVFKGINRSVWLFHHQTKPAPKSGIALLFLHGDHAHPYTTLHLADQAADEKVGHIYSIHLAYDDAHAERHQAQLKQAIDKIEQVVRDSDGCFKGVIAIGHSRGALEVATCAFANGQDERIKAVISIAGRFKVTPPPDRAPRDSLKPSVATLEKALQDKPDANLYQIAASEDWCTPLEASLTVDDPTCRLLVNGAMHLNVAYHPATRSQISEWLKHLCAVILDNALLLDRSRCVPPDILSQMR